jgi:hypothetical protein
MLNAHLCLKAIVFLIFQLFYATLYICCICICTLALHVTFIFYKLEKNENILCTKKKCTKYTKYLYVYRKL